MQSSYSGIQKAILTRRVVAVSSVFATALIAIGACSDAGEGDITTSDTSTSSSVSTTTTSASTSTTTSATTATATTGTGTTTSSSSGTGGGGQGGAGGAGGCIDPAVAASAFTIQTAELCVVASYTAPDLTLPPYGIQPTWGRHNGPLTWNLKTSATSNDVHIQRWAITGSSLTETETVISNVTQIPTNAFAGAQAVDLPFGGLTAVSWTGVPFTSAGGFVFVDSTHVSSNFVATGSFGTVAIGTAASSRILYTGVSAFNGPTNDTVALYAADFTNGTLGTSQAIAPWGESNGPVAVDSAGNLIAINTKFTTNTQEIHGFTASTIAEGQGATMGQTLLTTDGYGSALAAVAPKQGLSGLMLFQPQTGANGDYADVMVLRYNVSGNTMTMVSQETILALTTANTNLTLMTDAEDRIWVGAPAATGSVFYVLARP